KKRVAAGAALLDREMPGWPNIVSCSTLDIENFDTCILGQLYGNYVRGCSQLNLEIVESRAEHGFTFDQQRAYNRTTDSEQIQALGAEWKRIIEARRVA
ncbi:MAG: hypothetical protein ABIO00_02385, partial [Candidatus Paceibacterota bacterium]